MIPKYEELSYEQKTAVELNFDRNNLVIGAPGTGKTIVALYRAHKLYESGKKKVLMLVFNRPLMNYIRNVQEYLGWTNEFEVYTVNDWAFYKLYCGDEKLPHDNGIIKKSMPKAGGFGCDWKIIKDDFVSLGKLYDHVVVDEGQDFPNVFYEHLMNVSKNVTIFADPNQSLQNEKSSIDEILKIINKESYFTLSLNYRNSSGIVNYTRKYCYDKSIFAESYKKANDIEVLTYADSIDERLNQLVNIIKKYSKDDEIGIIAPTDSSSDNKNKLRMAIYKKLNEELGANYNVSIYYNDKTESDESKTFDGYNNVNFNEKSIKIFSYGTVRGLDFDVVILFDTISNKINNKENTEEKNVDDFAKLIMRMNRLYVAATRAKKKLYIIPCEKTEIGLEIANDVKDINYSKFDKIENITSEECYVKSKELYDKQKYEEAMYYLHYAISILGFENNENYRDAIVLFSYLCELFNKSDFALGLITNYAEKNKIYDDQKLIYFYQSLLLDSFNNKKQFENPENFFETLSKINDNQDKEMLLSKYLTTYINNNTNIDVNFAKDYIAKYGFANTKAYKKFLDSCKMIEEENDNNDDKDYLANAELVNNMTGHELLDGSYILVVGSTRDDEERYIRKAEARDFVEKDFDFVFDYDKIVNRGVDIVPFSCTPKAIIVGSIPHSVKGKGDFSSLVAKWEQPGYPKLFKGRMDHSFSVSAFIRLLEDVIDYLKKCLIDKLKVSI